MKLLSRPPSPSPDHPSRICRAAAIDVAMTEAAQKDKTACDVDRVVGMPSPPPASLF